MALFRPFDNGTLSAKMIELIAQKLAQEDLGSFRQASRMCAAGVSKVFKENLRSLRVRLATESSIANAVKIVNHAESGAAVQELILVDNSADDPANHDFSARLDGDEPLLGHVRAARTKARTTYSQQTSMRERGSDRRLLTQLFDKCDEIGIKEVVFESENCGGWDEEGHWNEDL
ncbi:hypothetical protein TI39_contig351g00010 [Zymoseptoria brevis]|uniref:Uncharacterized protein n=1 Tax=Zymoseptoria brevis TaxID=1047168 RepID=A0A0F4GQT2_9PEZI|nr:hypothetical protein TI39_contig351g00010 [Zymoseptoria brevis]